MKTLERGLGGRWCRLCVRDKKELVRWLSFEERAIDVASMWSSCFGYLFNGNHG